MGGVDVLVNNAGLSLMRLTAMTTEDQWDKVIDTNLKSTFLASKLFIRDRLRKKRPGAIVNVSSVAATLSSPGEAAYDASKSALSVFSEAMAIDLWDSGVKVLVVYPGVVDTPLFQMPDNDPFTAPVEFITVGELVNATFDALDRGALEVYVPEYFKELATGKANNLEGFVSGTAEYMRQQTAGT